MKFIISPYGTLATYLCQLVTILFIISKYPFLFPCRITSIRWTEFKEEGRGRTKWSTWGEKSVNMAVRIRIDNNIWIVRNRWEPHIYYYIVYSTHHISVHLQYMCRYNSILFCKLETIIFESYSCRIFVYNIWYVIKKIETYISTQDLAPAQTNEAGLMCLWCVVSRIMAPPGQQQIDSGS